MLVYWISILIFDNDSLFLIHCHYQRYIFLSITKKSSIISPVGSFTLSCLTFKNSLSTKYWLFRFFHFIFFSFLTSKLIYRVLYLMYLNKKSAIPIIVNPFSSSVSLIGLFTTSIFCIWSFNLKYGLSSRSLVSTLDISAVT